MSAPSFLARAFLTRSGRALLAFALPAFALHASGDAALAGPTDARPPRSRVLSDGWLFQPDPLGVGDAQRWQRPDLERSGWRKVAVPTAWDHYDAAMEGYEGVGWYALALPPDLAVASAWQRLRFGRANHRAKVWVDGHATGENLTGYLPFEVAASPWLAKDAPTWIVVRVENGVRYDWLPGSTTVEWVQYGGLLEPVELLTTARAYVDAVAIRAQPPGMEARARDARVSVTVEIANTSDVPFDGRVQLEILQRGAGEAVRVAPRATASVLVELTLPNANLWTLEERHLYVARVRLLDEGGEVDAVDERFGVRSIEAKGREILLNGRPLRIRGVNRYDEFPGRGPVVDESTIRADLLAVKATGANLVRTHYPQAPATLAIADEIGLLFMEEVPLNWWRATFRPPVPPEFDNDRIVDLAEHALEQMVRRDGNHPSLAVWSVANECQTADELGARSMQRLLRRAKELDPTRLATYVANRAFEENQAFAFADLVAVNLYFGMWDGDVANGIGDLERLVEAPTRDALGRIAKLFPEKPILLSEFGTIGIPGSGGDVRFSEDYQAAYLTAVWRAVDSAPETCGGIVWSWADYRHRRGFTNDFPSFFGPFGIVTIDRRPKKALAALTEIWNRAALRR